MKNRSYELIFHKQLVGREENFVFCDPLAKKVKETFYYEDARVKIDD